MAEFARGRVCRGRLCQGLSLSGAEFVWGRDVQYPVLFIYNSIVDYWLFTCPLVQAGSHGYL